MMIDDDNDDNNDQLTMTITLNPKSIEVPLHYFLKHILLGLDS